MPLPTPGGAASRGQKVNAFGPRLLERGFKEKWKPPRAVNGHGKAKPSRPEFLMVADGAEATRPVADSPVKNSPHRHAIGDGKHLLDCDSFVSTPLERSCHCLHGYLRLSCILILSLSFTACCLIPQSFVLFRINIHHPSFVRRRLCLLALNPRFVSPKRGGVGK